MASQPETEYAKAFLAIACKNGLLSREVAVECLLACTRDGRSVSEVVREEGLLSTDKVELIEAGLRKMGKAVTPLQEEEEEKQAPGPARSADPIPGYSIVGKLGMGGTATVFLAEDEQHGRRKVALKILKPVLAKDPKALENFLREADLLKKFRHTNIVEGYDFGTAGPLSYMVLEYLEGESVFDLIEREGALPESRALEIILEAGKALSYIQEEKIIHRDIKPDNLMLVKDGRVVLCDLGFAVPMDASEIPGLEEKSETTSGTVQYMSPEQARGQLDLDVRTDIYSLGATLYHMVMGSVPFSGEDNYEVMAKQVMEAINSTVIKNRGISRHMHYFIERMMSKDKDLRYANSKELVEDITEQIEGFRSLQYKPDEPEAPKTTTRKTTRKTNRPMNRTTVRKTVKSPLTTRLQRGLNRKKGKDKDKGEESRPPLDREKIKRITERFRRR